MRFERKAARLASAVLVAASLFVGGPGTAALAGETAAILSVRVVVMPAPCDPAHSTCRTPQAASVGTTGSAAATLSAPVLVHDQASPGLVVRTIVY